MSLESEVWIYSQARAERINGFRKKLIRRILRHVKERQRWGTIYNQEVYGNEKNPRTVLLASTEEKKKKGSQEGPENDETTATVKMRHLKRVAVAWETIS